MSHGVTVVIVALLLFLSLAHAGRPEPADLEKANVQVSPEWSSYVLVLFLIWCVVSMSGCRGRGIWQGGARMRREGGLLDEKCSQCSHRLHLHAGGRDVREGGRRMCGSWEGEMLGENYSHRSHWLHLHTATPLEEVVCSPGLGCLARGFVDVVIVLILAYSHLWFMNNNNTSIDVLS